MNQNSPYDRYGDVYNVSRVLDAQNRFNLTAYEQYSPLYLPATYAIMYLFTFALSTCVLVHTLLYHGRSLWKGIKNIRVEQDDIHAKLMRNYPEVPDWWYFVSFVLFYCMMIVVAEAGARVPPRRHVCLRFYRYGIHRCTLGSSFKGFPRPSGQVSCYDKTYLKDFLPRRHVYPNPDMESYVL